MATAIIENPTPAKTVTISYCNSLTSYSRYKTRVVHIGAVPMGDDNPIRIQSMTTTDTMDTKATVEQSIRIIKAGADYVRITAPSLREAQNLETIKRELKKRGYSTPLIADIHFTPNAAELAARIVEKVRVNPGNYADKKNFIVREYTDAEYNAELERIRERFIPLIRVCKEYGTAMRIGTNHGSLSDRIMNHYGDTPLGMVESALEFARICEDEGFYNIVFSMKASNPIVMVQAYRLLINKMQVEEMNYPLHLGVTEAGEGEDGRIKSATGIGTLLEDGIGDTIRVSLTEEPEYEVPVAIALVNRYEKRAGHKEIKSIEDSPVNPFEYNKRASDEVANIGGSNVPVVIADFSDQNKITAATLFSVGYGYSSPLDKWTLSDMACDYIYVGDNKIDFKTPENLGLIYNSEVWAAIDNPERAYPLFCKNEYFKTVKKSEHLNFVAVDIETLTQAFIDKIKDDKAVVLVFETSNDHGMAEQRRMFFELIDNDCYIPIIIKRNYNELSKDNLRLHSSADLGGLLLDGLGDGIWMKYTDLQGFENLGGLANNTTFGILQATRTRISKTDYISCPSCGRTLFDLQETTAKIHARTGHLKGIKIGIMGCIVNGPGEMADADYGYVGTGPGKITLYKGKDEVKRNVQTKDAVNALIELIKENGDWVDIKI